MLGLLRKEQPDLHHNMAMKVYRYPLRLYYKFEMKWVCKTASIVSLTFVVNSIHICLHDMAGKDIIVVWMKAWFIYAGLLRHKRE